jgi:hemoglobin
MTGRSLYERLGGVNAIATVVDRFSDRIVDNPKLNANPALRAWNATGQLPGLKFMRTLWVCQATGGPFRHTGKDLRAAHAHLHITSEEFDEVGAEIGRARAYLGVPEREAREVLAAIVARKAEVVHPSRSGPGSVREEGAGRREAGGAPKLHARGCAAGTGAHVRMSRPPRRPGIACSRAASPAGASRRG